MVLAGAVVMLAALYLLGFGALAVAVPARASGYLLGFATSARMHWLELIARVAVGLAFVGYAPNMEFGAVFHYFGLILVVTSVGLAVLPWRWHQCFARKTVPAVRPYLRVIGIVAVAAGAFVFWALAGTQTGGSFVQVRNAEGARCFALGIEDPEVLFMGRGGARSGPEPDQNRAGAGRGPGEGRARAGKSHIRALLRPRLCDLLPWRERIAQSFSAGAHHCAIYNLRGSKTHNDSRFPLSLCDLQRPRGAAAGPHSRS